MRIKHLSILRRIKKLLQQQRRFIAIHACGIQLGHFCGSFVKHFVRINKEEAARGCLCKNATQFAIVARAVGSIPAQPDDTVDGMIDQRAQQIFAALHFPLRVLHLADIAEHQHAARSRGCLAGCDRRHLQMQEAPGIGQHFLRITGFQGLPDCR